MNATVKTKQDLMKYFAAIGGAPGRLFSSSPKLKSYMRFNVATSLDSAALPALAALLGR